MPLKEVEGQLPSSPGLFCCTVVLKIPCIERHKDVALFVFGASLHFCVPRDPVLQNNRHTRWFLEEFALAHTHSKNKTGKYLVSLMLDEIKSSETGDANLKDHIETKTYLNCKDLVSSNKFPITLTLIGKLFCHTQKKSCKHIVNFPFPCC